MRSVKYHINDTILNFCANIKEKEKCMDLVSFSPQPPISASTNSMEGQ